jgi:methylenetetrahydrofolate dehydrogenase (NADP+) / methenyltetrahydrofolate cyclohydrolase
MTTTKAKTIDGRALAQQIKDEVRAQIAKLGITPGLAAILVGNDEASKLYTKIKERAARRAGIMFSLYRFGEDAAEEEVVKTVNWLNRDEEIDAILVQLPLPSHLDEHKIISAVAPEKDVDGLHPANVKKILAGNSARVLPGLILGIIQLLQSTGEDLSGKQAVIAARSPEFTGVLAYVLNEFGVSNKVINPDTPDAKRSLASADIVIVAVGQANWLKAEDIKQDAIIIDVGTNRREDGNIVGDADFADCSQKASWITPTPGGVGPMTVAMLLKNTVTLSQRRRRAQLNTE